MTLVIGEISYTNIMPFFYYIDRKKLIDLGCSFVPKIPAQLNQGMANQTVDVGGISSFAYGEHCDSFSLLPNLSVSSLGTVGSIFLFSKKPIESLNGANIALTSSSATSINLLKVILAYFYQYEVNYTVMEPNFDKMLEEHDAALLIGDDAIVSYWKHKDHYYLYDLGELWYEHTGLSMTFAVFAVRDEVIDTKKAALEELYSQLTMSKIRSEEANFIPMIGDIQAKFGGSSVFWREYFQGLCYDLNEKQLEGLRYYYELASQLGLLPHKVNVKLLANVTKHCHSM